MDMLTRNPDDTVLHLNSALLNAFPTGVVVCNPAGMIMLANAELHRLFGYADQALIGKPIEILLPMEHSPHHKAHIHAFFSNPTKRSMGTGRELFGRRYDGTTFPVEIGLNPIDTPVGKQVIATVTDISNRRRLEHNFAKIVEAAPVGMLIVDVHGNINHCNKQLLGIFGYQLDDLQGRPLETLLPERHRGKHHSYRNAYIEKPTVRAMGIERDLTGLHKNGTEVPVEIGLNPIETAEGNYIVATITDITQRKKSELKLKQVNADLDEFTYVASHDLKSPLRGIESLLEWIEEDLGETAADTVKNNLKRAHLRIKRMEKLIEDLLEYARSGRQQSETKTLDLKQTLDDIVQLLAPPASFSIEIGGYLGEIQASSIPLETVLRNLISNALKHHDQNHGTLQITITPEDAYCIFDIQDDGPGIPTNAHERIFKLFQTLSSEDGTRSGVGLAVCKRLVEAHGGKIEVHAQDNQRGTRFRFWWPRFSRRELNV